MDRLDALRAFVIAMDEGSLAAAGRRLGRSPAAITRAIAMLEREGGAPLFERTTRLTRPTDAGERFAVVARRVLAEFDDLLRVANGTDAAPRGVLTLTAPLVAGSRILRPIVDDYLDLYPDVRAELMLLDRMTNLIDEGIDVALRIAHLPDSALIAIPVGRVRRVVCAAPAYLERHPSIESPRALSTHATISVSESRQAQSWSFPARDGRAGGQSIGLAPRLSVNSIEAAKASAIAGKGLTRLLSYQIEEEIRDGRLRVVLAAFEPRPLPVHLVSVKARLAIPKTRHFVDLAVPLLKLAFAATS